MGRSTAIEKHREKIAVYGINLQNRLQYNHETFHIAMQIFDKWVVGEI